MNTKELQSYLNTFWDAEIIPTLTEYIKIPNKSPAFDPDWESLGHMEDALNLAIEWAEKHRPEKSTLHVKKLKGRTPLILLEIPGERDGNILMYGHLDKQPEMMGWHEGTGPWDPVMRDGKLYGRGGADDGYAMFAALGVAWSNRQMITHWTRKSFERVFKQSESDLGMQLVYDVAHNIAKIEEHKIDGRLKPVVVHRKGATRAFPANRDEVPAKYRDLGQPVLVPGSMGTGSWILLGKENSMNISFGSTAHGAGRMMSRTKARRNFKEHEVKKSLSDKGIFLKSLTRDGVVEETPQAYKDVDAVVNVSHELGIATKVAKLVPIGVIKG